MSTDDIYTQLSILPENLKNEVSDFIEFLSEKQKKAPTLKERQFGCARGLIKMSPDFDDPLDDFKDYM